MRVKHEKTRVVCSFKVDQRFVFVQHKNIIFTKLETTQKINVWGKKITYVRMKQTAATSHS